YRDQLTIGQCAFSVTAMTTLWASIMLALALLFILLVHVLFMVQLYRLKMNKCFQHRAHWLSNRSMFARLQSDYVELYREMSMLNHSLKGCWFSMDLMIKLSCTQFVV